MSWLFPHLRNEALLGKLCQTRAMALPAGHLVLLRRQGPGLRIEPSHLAGGGGGRRRKSLGELPAVPSLKPKQSKVGWWEGHLFELELDFHSWW